MNKIRYLIRDTDTHARSAIKKVEESFSREEICAKIELNTDEYAAFVDSKRVIRLEEYK